MQSSPIFGHSSNHTLADLEVKARNPQAWALFLDQAGNICEGTSNNIFVISEGRLLTPREQSVLAGVSRQTVFELAEELGIPLEERDIDLYDATKADEIFLTMTSMCICPVRSLEGTRTKAVTVPGPVTRRLQEAWIKRVDCDFIDQFTRRSKTASKVT